jgi:hypothetical protein
VLNVAALLLFFGLAAWLVLAQARRHGTLALPQKAA